MGQVQINPRDETRAGRYFCEKEVRLRKAKKAEDDINYGFSGSPVL